jgi:predicted SnoaL-like aldol condensation-catalyzing enzyme
MTMLTIGLVLAVSAAQLPPGHPVPETHCAGEEALLTTYLEMSRILFNERQGDRAGEFYEKEFISHNNDEGGDGISTVRPADMAAMWNSSRVNEPERQVINNVIICKDGLVVAQVTTKGKRNGTDNVRRRYSTSAMDIYRFKNGKVVERWGNNDHITIVRQTGQAVDLSLTPLPPEK